MSVVLEIDKERLLVLITSEKEGESSARPSLREGRRGRFAYEQRPPGGFHDLKGDHAGTRDRLSMNSSPLFEG